MRARTRFLTLAALMLTVSCGGGPPASPLPTVRAAPASAAPPASVTPGPAAEVDMCSLVPLAEVQAASPFATPLSIFEPGATPGMCEYRSADDADYPVSVLLVVTDFGSPEGAQSHMTAYRQNIGDAGVALADVPGVGDDAVSSGVDEVGVHAIVGRYALDANLGGEWLDTTDAAKVAAGTNPLRTLIPRLP